MKNPARAALIAAGVVCMTLVLSACGSTSEAPPTAAATTPRVAVTTPTGDGAVAPTAVTSSNSPSSSPSSAPPAVVALAPPKVAGVAWKPVGRTINGEHAVYVAHVLNDTVGLMWMNPKLLKFRFIPGYKYPEKSPTRDIDTKPSTWVPRMVAAFNGGFHLKDDLGGYFYNGTMVKPMQNGRAVLVVKKDGTMSVGVWGKDVTTTKGALAVRQNMRPLVVKGKSQASTNDDPGHWGLANGGLPTASRAALAELPDGSLVFAYGHEVVAAAMGNALVKVGARTAMMLDMNKSWPMGFYYGKSNGGQPAGHPILDSVMNDPSVYYEQFSKDFVVALAP